MDRAHVFFAKKIIFWRKYLDKHRKKRLLPVAHQGAVVAQLQNFPDLTNVPVATFLVIYFHH
jgi:hypothetical protein